MDGILLRQAAADDLETVWIMFKTVIDEAVYYPYDEHTTRGEIEHSWINLQNQIVVAESGGRPLGAYILRPNQAGYGNHIVNAAYMVAPAARGRNVGRLLGEHSIIRARELGYYAMQFNYVVSTNTAAVQLWQKLGFLIIGTVPGGFRHRDLGMVDVYIMFLKL
ncbi:MAG TPA: GNAT family N-acetyltransferase [Flavilitoribacter sp.]|nr:GNAT family N-acetyltransferase [Flavilitoribacter sp.]